MRALSTRNDDPAGRQPPVRQGPRWLRHRRGRRDARPRGAGACAEARCPDPRRALRLRRHCRRVPHHPARHPAARAQFVPGGGRSRRRASIRPRSTSSCAHATSTPGGRPRRARRPSARCFGDARAEASASRPPRAPSGTRSAPPARIGAVVAIMAMRDGCVPPTLNLTDPRSARSGISTARPVAPGRGTSDVALVNAFGFGGQNSSLVLRRWDRHDRRARDVGELLALIDRLEALLEGSDLTEIEVEAGAHDADPAQARAPSPRLPRGRPPPLAASGRPTGSAADAGASAEPPRTVRPAAITR